jgi:hypothetical protein
MKYYVDDSGTVGAGTKASPWGALSQIDWSKIKGGTELYIDGTHRITSDYWEIATSGMSDAPVRIYFGSTAKLIGAKQLAATTDWTSLGSGLWRSAANSFPKSTGFALFGTLTQGNVGVKVADKGDLNAAREWYHDTTDKYVTVYTGDDTVAGNPYTVYGTAEIAFSRYTILIQDRAFIEVYGGESLHSATSTIIVRRSHDITFDGHAVGWSGGGGGVGDGYQIDGNGTYNVCVRNCTVQQIYDGAFMPQVFSASVDEVMHDIYIEDNTILNCGIGGAAAAHSARASEVYNVYFRRNKCYNSGYGWSGINNSVHGKGFSVKEATGATSSYVHDIYFEDNVVNRFANVGLNMYEGHAIFRRNHVTGGTGLYTTETPAGIRISGGTSGESADEATGEFSGNHVYFNACYGVYVINNTPTGGETVLIDGNTFIANTTAEIRTATSTGTVFTNNTVIATTALCAKDEVANPITADGNAYFKTDAGNWFEHGATGYATLALWAAATSQDGDSTDTDPRPVVVNTDLASAIAITSPKTYFCNGLVTTVTLTAS